MKASRYRTWVTRRGVFVAALLALAFVVAAQAVPLRSSVMSRASIGTTYGGEAYGVGVSSLLGGVTTYADSGALPSNGGFLVADYTPVSDPAADATVFLSYTSGLQNASESEVATTDVTLFPGTAYEVVASFVYSVSNAACTGASGYSEIPDLTVGGVAVPVTGDANQVYQVPGVLGLVINEQSVSSSGGLQSITVNALDVTVNGVGEVIVSSAQSAIDCNAVTTLSTPSLSTQSVSAGEMHAMWVPPADFMTGGGYFFANAQSSCPSDRVNFGFNVGPRPGTYPTLLGHVNVVDHGGVCAPQHFEGVDVTDYHEAGDPQNVCRIASGDANVNGVSGFTYMLGVCDFGEPGRMDRFDFQIWMGSTMVYFASNGQPSTACGTDANYCGNLPGGNIQLHPFSTN